MSRILGGWVKASHPRVFYKNKRLIKCALSGGLFIEANNSVIAASYWFFLLPQWQRDVLWCLRSVSWCGPIVANDHHSASKPNRWPWRACWVNMFPKHLLKGCLEGRCIGGDRQPRGEYSLMHVTFLAKQFENSISQRSSQGCTWFVPPTSLVTAMLGILGSAEEKHFLLLVVSSHPAVQYLWKV